MITYNIIGRRHCYRMPLHLAYVLADGCIHHKISAIKLVRDMTGAGLLQCRMIVEALGENVHGYEMAKLVSIRSCETFEINHEFVVIIHLAP